MKNFIRVSVLTILLFAATILPGITAALSLSPWLYGLSAVLFLICNIFPTVEKNLSQKLHIAAGGTNLLISFLVLLVLDSAYVLTTGALWFGMFSTMFWNNVIVVYITELLIFWNGIIRIYCTSTMIGTRWRIVGILCGMIPIANIIVLVRLIHLARSEIGMEKSRTIRNRERKDMAVCATKYPIVLVHGVFFRDLEKLNYWGRIPEELEKNGATLYYGEQQSALGIEESAKEVAEKIKSIVEETGCEKVNVIAHSKGGLDSRYAISCLGADKYVASLTTVNTPHRGCVFAEWLLDHAPDKLREGIASKYNAVFTLIGDKNPDFLKAVNDLKASSCQKFNEQVKDVPGIYYQSVGSKINKVMSGVFPLNFSHLLAKYFDGPNDGLVTVSSSKWGEKFTYLESKAPDGVSHADVIDLARHDKPDLDIREFYVGLVSDLKTKGL